MSSSHDRRLRFSSIFPTDSGLVIRLFSYSGFFRVKTAFFAFRRNFLVQIETLKILFPEHFAPPIHLSSDVNAFNVLFYVSRQVRLCQSGGMAQTHLTAQGDTHLLEPSEIETHILEPSEGKTHLTSDS